jgi:hypothetical protein
MTATLQAKGPRTSFPLDRGPLEAAKERLTVIELGRQLFPDWKPAKSCRSPFREDRNASFSVFGDGRRWKDFASGEGGDAIDFLALARGIDTRTATKEFLSMAGADSPRPVTAQPLAPAKSRPASVARPAEMGPDLAAVWRDGLDPLHRSIATRESIEKWRHWPAGAVKTLADDGLMSCPTIDGARGIAFPVQVPTRDALGLLSTFNGGFHFRHKAARPDDRAKWSYHSGIPALPYVIGAGFLPYAQTVVVTEGQWDALTLAQAAGWLASDASWPECLTLFAVRGASAWRPLIDFWGDFFPKEARFILFADGDDAGGKWREPGNLADALRHRGHRVRIIRPRPGSPKDLNDIHRAKPITEADVGEWLATGGPAK